ATARRAAAPVVGRPHRTGPSTPSPTPPRGPLTPAHPHRRQTVLLVVVLLVLLAFVARLVYVQGLDSAALAAEAYDKRLLTVEIPADRGDILDAAGVVLATSVERYDLVVNQKQVAQWKDGVDAVVDAAALLAPLLGTPAPELGARLLGDDPYVVIAHDLAPDVYRQVMDLGIAGLSGERTTERLYPAGTTAGNIVGFVGGEGFGRAGLEQAYDDVLAGVAGSETYEQGARGQRIPTGDDDLVPASDGRDVQLTIDRDLQYMAQAAVDEAVRTHGAEWGTVEVFDVTTGAILALADSGTVDPNDPADANPSRAAAVMYEPGSTAKVVAMAAILEQGIATPTSPFVVPDQYAMPNGEVFKDSHPHAPLNLTLTGILSESSNTGTVMVGQNVPRQVRHDYLAAFGLGSLTGIGLPGETAGLLYPADTWDGRGEFAVLFGQAISVTTLQATQVFATLANGGVRVAPRIVAAVEDETGAMVPTEAVAPVRVVGEETADTIVSMLESAVVDGTGGNAAVPGYRIAGKTGTSQAFEGNGVVKNVASFVGIAPADDPRIVVNVALYDPKTSIYGGAVAAPVFSEVAGYALQYLGVPPSGTTAELFPTTWQ
ncbi:MAG TPA: penicillin-binding protein 2, partial [Actinotalea sp.]|nr:penicillin-binding protein 2 [Actinotalea sp.]